MHRPRRAALAVTVAAGALALPAAPAAAAQWFGPSLANGVDCTLIDGGCFPFAAVDSGGKALLAWTDYHGTEDAFATVRLPAASWQQNVNLSAVARDDGFGLDWITAAGLADSGDALVVGSSPDGDLIELYRVSGQSWNSRRVADGAQGEVMTPVGALGTGNAKVAAWVRNASGAWRVQARVGSSPAGSHGGVTTVSEQAAWEPYDLQAAVDGQGNAHLAWVERSGAERRLRVARRAAGGSWAAPSTLEGPSPGVTLLDLRVNRRGDAAVGWWATGGDGRARLRVALRAAAVGAWTGLGTVEDRPAAGTLLHGAIALGEQGELAATWTRADIPPGDLPVTNSRVLVADHAGVGSWPAVEVPGSTDTPDHVAVAHDIAFDGRGALVVGWLRTHRHLEGTYEDWGTARMAGGGWTPIRKLSDYGGPPAIVADGLGNTLVSTTGPQHSVWDAAGPRIVSSTIPDTATAGTPRQFSVTTVEAWSGIAGPPTWYFGDSPVGVSGYQVGHAYDAPGTYTVTVVQTDGIGNVSSLSEDIEVAAAAGSGPPPPRASQGTRIAGEAFNGRTLTCTPAVWQNGTATGPPVWWVGGQPVAVGQSYLLVPADVGRVVVCVSSAVNAFGTNDSVSAPVVPRPAPIPAAPPAPPAGGGATEVTPPPPGPAAASRARLGAAARGARVQLRARVGGRLRVVALRAPRSGIVTIPAALRGASLGWRIAPGPWRRAPRLVRGRAEVARVGAARGVRVEVREKVGRRLRGRVVTVRGGRLVPLRRAGRGPVRWRTAPGPWRSARLL